MTASYPRIHKISTVGVLKHYHQDYLIHEFRTDFTGKNGIGKSVLADLIQLIFVQDRKLIRFGTDGLQKSDRSIESIPYKHPYAYAYLSVEVGHDRFVIIGVCISKDTRAPIKPFIITQRPDINTLNLTVTDISFAKNDLIESSECLIAGSVPSVAELAVNLRNKFGIHLRSFNNRNDIQDYHRFLKNFQLLPINLAAENNLEAFARIIQSFSRAKNFDPTNSTMLKDFLFDEVGEEYYADFKRHQEDLRSLLARYKELGEISTSITKRQIGLLSLKRLEDEKLTKEMLWKKAELDKLKSDIDSEALYTRQLEEKLDADKLSKSFLEAEIINLNDNLIPAAKKERDNSETIHITLLRCDDLKKQAEKLLRDKETLSNIPILNLANFETKTIIDKDTPIETLTNNASNVLPILNEYESIDHIRQKAIEQEQQLQNLIIHNKDLIEQADELKKIVDNNIDNTLFSEILREGNPLSLEQESIVFHLLSTSFGRPADTSIGSKFVTDLTIISPQNILPEPQVPEGFWLSTGPLTQLIRRKTEPQILSSAEKMQEARSILSVQLENKQKQLFEIKEELRKIQLGKPYDNQLVPEIFDLRLVSFIHLDTVEYGITILREIPIRIKHIDSQIEQLNDEFRRRLSELTIVNDILELDVLVDTWQKACYTHRDYHQKLEANLLEYRVKVAELGVSIPNDDLLLADSLERLDQKQVSMSKLEGEVKAIRIRIKDTKMLERSHSDASRAKGDFDSAYNEYTDFYRELALTFTKPGTATFNADVYTQIQERLFHFRALETAMLWGIGLLEDVGNKLSELNSSRMNCRRTIYDKIKSVFRATAKSYRKYKDQVRDLNTFFAGRKISKHFFFEIEFNEERLSDNRLLIDWVNTLNKESDQVFESSELELGQTVDSFVENFYHQLTQKEMRSVKQLVDPKSYFALKAKLVDDQGKEAPGSTGEAYTAIILLGIGRLSVLGKDGTGLKFVILEETASIDDENFELVVDIASEFGYQLLTLTPKPYNIGSVPEWFLHQLIRGDGDRNINYPVTASFFRSQGISHVLEVDKR